MSEAASRPQAGRMAYLSAAAFYLLVALEFFYMASPFAATLYAAYAPGLRLLARSPRLAWLSQTFLPHFVVQTRSPLLDQREAVGATLFVGGLAVFAVCAAQVYYAKLVQSGRPVTGGVYRLLRHPQYVALAVSGVGLVLLWPRFIALVALLLMMLVYALLARLEERECRERFGRRSLEYAQRTGVLLPHRPGAAARSRSLPAPALVAVWLTTSLLAVAGAERLRLFTVDSLYASYRDDAAVLSVARLGGRDLETLVTTTLEDAAVLGRLAMVPRGTKLLGYVVPEEWSVPEIPLRRADGNTDHLAPRDHGSRYRVVLTRAELGSGADARGRDILLRAVGRTPLCEATVDLASGRVQRVDDPPAKATYAGVPVPLF